MKFFPLAFLIMTLSVHAAPELCFDEAGRDFGVDPILLMAISIPESKLNNKAINNANSNGSEDVCGMQINSSNYEKLKSFNISRKRLLDDPCICVYTGAWMLSRNLNQYGRNWDSVGIYNTGPNPKLIKKRREYAEKVKSVYRILLARKMILERKPEKSVSEPLAENNLSLQP